MIPRFLRSEVAPFASVEFVAAAVAAAGLAVTAPLAPVAPLAQQEDDDAECDDTREELYGSTCGTACGNCGRCS
jgi:hypothetical protein